MAKIVGKPNVGLEFNFQLNEAEARALDALVGYGTDKFLEVFYQKLGKAYLSPHEQGLRSLFDAVRKNVPPLISRLNDAKSAFNE